MAACSRWTASSPYPYRGRVPPSDAAVGPDEQRVSFLDFARTMPVVKGIFAAFSAHYDGAQVRKLEFVRSCGPRGAD